MQEGHLHGNTIRSMPPLSPPLKGPDKCFNEIWSVVMQFHKLWGSESEYWRQAEKDKAENQHI